MLCKRKKTYKLIPPYYKILCLQSIAECTQDMDPTTWNAYQIVANRARAVCYSTRQQQFRMKTEMTVNKLVTHTQQQVDTIKQIQVKGLQIDNDP